MAVGESVPRCIGLYLTHRPEVGDPQSITQSIFRKVSSRQLQLRNIELENCWIRLTAMILGTCCQPSERFWLKNDAFDELFQNECTVHCIFQDLGKPFTSEEMLVTFQRTNVTRAPRIDEIPMEYYKYGGEMVQAELLKLCNEVLASAQSWKVDN